MDSNILISIVIPVKNGATWLEVLFQKLREQTLFGESEIICIDSGSADDSVAIIGQNNVRLIQIPPESFNHGGTRNLGVREARGRYVVMTVQDALPADGQWLQKLLDGFIDEDVAGVCGQQIVPHDKDKNPIQWFRPHSEPKLEVYGFETADDFDVLTPDEKKKICGWDDVNACYRRDVLLKYPFREINFSEDAAWAMDILRKGMKIAYNKKARVYHYHHENFDFAFRRALTVYYHRYKLFGFVPSSPVVSLKNKLSWINLLTKTPISVSDKLRWWKYNVKVNNAQKKAHVLFIKALNQGEMALDRLHGRYCGKPPQAQAVVKSKP